MNKFKLTLIAIILGTTSLIGCSKNHKINQLSSDVKNLDLKVDKLHNDINDTRSDVKSVKDNASRANKRLDNQVHSYHK